MILGQESLLAMLVQGWLRAMPVQEWPGVILVPLAIPLQELLPAMLVWSELWAMPAQW